MIKTTEGLLQRVGTAISVDWSPKRNRMSMAQTTLSLFALVVFGALFVRVAFAPEHGLATPSTVGALATALALAVIGVAWRPMPRLASWLDGLVTWKRRVVLSGIHGTLTFASGVLALAVYQPFRGGWDVDVVSQAAFQWATTGTLTRSQFGYFEQWTNNIGQLNVLHLVAMISGPSAYAMVTLLSGPVLASITIALVYNLAWRRGGTSAALLAGAASWILVGMNPYVAVPYTDMYVLLFPVACILMMEKAYSSYTIRGRVGWIAGCGAIAGIASQIKVTVLIVAIAATIVLVAGGILAGHCRRAVTGLCAITLIASTLVSFEAVGMVSRAAIPSGTAGFEPVPLEYWVATGMSAPYGEWNSDVIRLMETTTSSAIQRELLQAVIDRRLGELGPGGYSLFLYNKLTWVYSDGTFFAFGEAQLAPGVAFAYSNLIARAIRSLVVPWGRPLNVIYTTVLQGIWLLVLAGCLLTLLRKVRAPFDWYTSVLTLTVLGVTAYQVIWEARARYLLAFVPLFILLALRQDRRQQRWLTIPV